MGRMSLALQEITDTNHHSTHPFSIHCRTCDGRGTDPFMFARCTSTSKTFHLVSNVIVSKSSTWPGIVQHKTNVKTSTVNQ